MRGRVRRGMRRRSTNIRQWLSCLLVPLMCKPLSPLHVNTICLLRCKEGDTDIRTRLTMRYW